jgi:uncharacterized LabA/DUF88 family protein
MNSKEKAAIFIDGGYLNQVLKNNFGAKDVNYLKLSEMLCENCSVNRLRTYFYHCLPLVRKGNMQDVKRQASMERFLAKLRRFPRFEIKLGKLQIIGGQFKQKMVDVLMSLDIVEMCIENKIQHAIIIAGDSDFIPAIRKAKNAGAIVHLFYHPKSIHQQILDEVDELHEINEELIRKILQD